MRRFVISILLILVAIGLYFWFASYNKVPSVDVPRITNKEDYKNISYNVDGVNVLLVNGVSEIKYQGSVATTTTSYFGNDAKGDINGDGKDDVAFLLVQDGGGSGLFTYLAVAIKTETGYKSSNTIFLGDRLAPQNTEIKDGIIVANYADRLLNEPMSTDPSIGVSRYFKMENDRLVEIKGEMGD